MGLTRVNVGLCKLGSLTHGVRKGVCLQAGEPWDTLLAAQSRLQTPAAASRCWGLKASVTLGMGSMRKQARMLKDVSSKMRRALKSLAPCCKNKLKCCCVTPNPSKASNTSLEIKKKGKTLIWKIPQTPKYFTLKKETKNPNKQQNYKQSK